jgi:dTDP-4-dehydrorhamnose 3,5-epimerase
MILKELKIKGCYLIKSKPIKDYRGDFSRVFCKNILKKKNINFNIKQINYSFNKTKGTLRGMHFSSFHLKELKIVQCLSGEIFDMLIDLRKNSPTYKKCIKNKLSDENYNSILIAPGVAHGFQTVTNNVLISYYTNIFYNKKFDLGINPLDQKFLLNWPIKNKIISNRDLSFNCLK